MVLYQKGDYGAFKELYDRHAGKVLGYVRKHLFAQDEAQDLLQVVFLRLHEHRTKYDPRFPFLPWLFSITRNAVIDQSRKKRALPTEEKDLERMLTPSEESPAVDADLGSALASLPIEQQELIQMRFDQGLSFEEIGNRMRLNSPSVRKRVSRVIQELRKRIRGH